MRVGLVACENTVAFIPLLVATASDMGRLAGEMHVCANVPVREALDLHWAVFTATLSDPYILQMLGDAFKDSVVRERCCAVWRGVMERTMCSVLEEQVSRQEIDAMDNGILLPPRAEHTLEDMEARLERLRPGTILTGSAVAERLLGALPDNVEEVPSYLSEGSMAAVRAAASITLANDN